MILLVFFIPLIYGKYYSGFYYRSDIENKQQTLNSLLQNEIDNTGVNKTPLKSSTTLGELSEKMNISLEELKNYLGISSVAESSIKLRDIEDVEPGVTFKLIKQKTAEYLQD